MRLGIMAKRLGLKRPKFGMYSLKTQVNIIKHVGMAMGVVLS